MCYPSNKLSHKKKIHSNKQKKKDLEREKKKTVVYA